MPYKSSKVRRVREELSDEVLERIIKAKFSVQHTTIAHHERNVSIVKAYREGESATVIGADYGLSGDRVRRIIDQYITYAVRLRIGPTVLRRKRSTRK